MAKVNCLQDLGSLLGIMPNESKFKIVINPWSVLDNASGWREEFKYGCNAIEFLKHINDGKSYRDKIHLVKMLITYKDAIVFNGDINCDEHFNRKAIELLELIDDEDRLKNHIYLAFEKTIVVGKIKKNNRFIDEHKFVKYKLPFGFDLDMEKKVISSLNKQFKTIYDNYIYCNVTNWDGDVLFSVDDMRDKQENVISYIIALNRKRLNFIPMQHDKNLRSYLTKVVTDAFKTVEKEDDLQSAGIDFYYYIRAGILQIKFNNAVITIHNNEIIKRIKYRLNNNLFSKFDYIKDISISCINSEPVVNGEAVEINSSIVELVTSYNGKKYLIPI